MDTPTSISVPGRGLDGFFSVAKHSISTLIYLLVGIITQAKSVDNLTPSKIQDISRRSYINTTIKRSQSQPQQMFKTPLYALNIADEEPSVIASKKVADMFETIASHNFIILLISVCVLVYLIYKHSGVLFGKTSSE